MREVLDSTAKVLALASDVTVDQAAADRFAERQTEHSLAVPPWDREHHYQGNDDRTVAYLLVLASQNFCPWGRPHWHVVYRGEPLLGYFAVSSALKVAFEQGWPLHDPKLLARIECAEVEEIFSGEGQIPLIERRAEIFRELGRVLAEHFDGRAMNLVRSAECSALRLARIVVECLPSFRDVAHYRGHAIQLYKRAQILCADLWGAFEGSGPGTFVDIDQLTAFADDSLPQILRAQGVLQYSDRLAARVDQGVPLQAGGEMEVEIRAATIHAVEAIKEALRRRGIERHSVELDWVLWNASQDTSPGRRHIVTSVFY